MRLVKEDILSIFTYRDGTLIRKKTGERGYKRPDGYVSVRLNGKSFYEHRLIYFLFNNEFPNQVDHINGDRSDNRIDNLRAATNSQNAQNRRTSENKGTYKNKLKGKWCAMICINGKRKNLGYFESKKDAKEAYRVASKSHFGEYACE